MSGTAGGVAATHRRAAGAGWVSIFILEAIGSIAMWGPLPLGWIWAGSRVADATGSAGAAALVAVGGFVATTIVLMRALVRLDRVWIGLRCRAGYAQTSGPLTQIVVVSATVAIALFLLWYYVLEQAYVIPFMPSR